MALTHFSRLANFFKSKPSRPQTKLERFLANLNSNNTENWVEKTTKKNRRELTMAIFIFKFSDSFVKIIELGLDEVYEKEEYFFDYDLLLAETCAFYSYILASKELKKKDAKESEDSPYFTSLKLALVMCSVYLDTLIGERLNDKDAIKNKVLVYSLADFEKKNMFELFNQRLTSIIRTSNSEDIKNAFTVKICTDSWEWGLINEQILNVFENYYQN